MNPTPRNRADGVIGLLVLLSFTGPAAGESIQLLPGEDVQRAIQTTAEGATVVLPAGDHAGPLVVDRRLTLRGAAGARLVGSREGSVLRLEADGIRVEDLEIVGSGWELSRDDAGVLVLGDDAEIRNVQLRKNLHGIYVRGARNTRLIGNQVTGLGATEEARNVERPDPVSRDDGVHHRAPGTRELMGNGLHLWNADGALVAENHIQQARDGIYVAHTNRATFFGNRVHGSRYAIHYMYSDDNVLEANELWDNVAGAALMFSRNLEVVDNVLRDHGGFRAYGLLLQDVDASIFRGNVIRGNRVGMRLQGSNGNRWDGNVVVGNLAGMTIDSSSQHNALTRNRMGFNLRQIELTGPPPPTDWSVEGVGNRWHGALLLDLTGDGVSQWPHHEVDVVGERRERVPAVQLLTGSLGIRVVEWALSRAPVPGMRYVTDPHPVTRRRGDDRGP